MLKDYEKIIDFIVEVDKLKSVDRKIKVLNGDRYENSAEHSWQVALFAMSFARHAKQDINITKVMQMLLLHDVVEIDTGDKFAYAADHEDFENELAAAERIFGILPSDTATEFLSLWREFEAKETLEAQFAAAMDRLIPIILNLNNEGQSWKAHGICRNQVLEKNKIVGVVNPELWGLIGKKLDEAVKQGHLSAD